MTQVRIRRENKFTTIPNEIVYDNTLSLKAKGLLLVLLSKPDDWVFHIDPLIEQSTDGERSFRSGFQELKDAGYVQKFPIRENGKIVRWETIVSDVKMQKNPLVENVEVVDFTGFPEKSEVQNVHVQNVDVENVDVQNRYTTNTYITNTDLTNTDSNNNYMTDRLTDTREREDDTTEFLESEKLTPFTNWQCAYQTYIGTAEFFRLSSAQSEKLKDYVKKNGFEESLLCEIIDRSKNKEHKFDYIEATMNKLGSQGIYTFAAYRANEQARLGKYQNANNGNKNNGFSKGQQEDKRLREAQQERERNGTDSYEPLF